jgi:methylenetetrahydrofolate dehydrogenase (NADP+)/methenyltetrahydrofolate cyclohydrolase
MSAKILDGKKLAEKIKQELKQKAKGTKPGLAVIQVGDRDASTLYVDLKVKDCADVGFHSIIKRMPEDTSEIDLMNVVDEFNQDKKIHGILVQLPLPKHINEQMVIDSILPMKDVDGFHPLSIGNVFLGNEWFAPCTPAGVMKLLDEYKIEIEGKEAVVVGRSNIVGKPMAILLLNRGATVTVCHRKTKDLAAHTRNADILVVAAGSPGLIKKDMVKPGAVVVDVGTTKVDGKLKGDVDFDKVKEVASYISPVPGGVGPMTRAMLLWNTYEAMKRQKEL